MSDAERMQVDRLLRAIDSYRAAIMPPDAALHDAVLAGIRGRTPARKRPAWHWLFEPRPIRLRPVWVPVIAAAAALLWLGVRPGADIESPLPSEATASVTSSTMFVHFQLTAPDANLVSIAGSFTDWRADTYRLDREDGGIWSITLALPLGEHQYQFVIDGDRWIPDPRAHAQIDDGFGGTNSLVIVGPRGVVQT
jgi:hypothetical protein